MNYYDLMEYLLTQTGKGLRKSKYGKQVLDWYLIPDLKVRSDGTIMAIHACEAKVILVDGTAFSLGMPPLLGENITETYNKDVVQEQYDSMIDYYATQRGWYDD